MSRNRGFAMPVIVGLIAVFAAILGVALVNLSAGQQVGFGLDLQGVRAYHAARAGAEWGMYHVLRPGFGGCAGINGRTVVFGDNLTGFRATLACRASLHEEGGGNVTLFAITSTACNDGADCTVAPSPPPLTYVNRQVRVTVAN